MLTSTKMLILAMLGLFSTVLAAGAEFGLGVSLEMVDEHGCSDVESELVSESIEASFGSIASGEWSVAHNGERTDSLNANNHSKATAQEATGDNRDLQSYYELCMLGLTYYCRWCPQCYGRRRFLRSSESLDGIKEQAESDLNKALAMQEISCLARNEDGTYRAFVEIHEY